MKMGILTSSGPFCLISGDRTISVRVNEIVYGVSCGG
jgi:hypothetical protein